MKKLVQNGFSAVEVLIVIAVIGLVGGAGWLVYNRQNNQPDSNDSDKVSENVTDATADDATNTPESTEGWKEVTNDKYYFSYKYPTTNKCEDFILDNSELSGSQDSGERINNSGVACFVSVQSSALPITVRVAVAGSYADQPNFGDTQMEGNTYYKLQSKGDITINEVSGTEWHYVPSDDLSDEIYYYHFEHKGFGYVIEINDNGYKLSAYDVTDLGKSIFSTFKFL